MLLPALCITAFLVSILTFFSGFGLGTILTPVFLLVFPVHLAVALTGLVHLFNNIFKLVLIGKHADRGILLRFGIPAVLAAFIGAWVLSHIPHARPLLVYSMFGSTFEVIPIKLLVSVLLLFFAVTDLLPFTKKLAFGKQHLFLGGALSGFFGGLSGNQGALRSAFLMHAGLSKEAFLGTTVVVSACVDVSRLSVYSSSLHSADLSNNVTLIVCVTISAICGAFFGNRWLKKVTLSTIRMVVAAFLIVVSFALGLGWL